VRKTGRKRSECEMFALSLLTRTSLENGSRAGCPEVFAFFVEPSQEPYRNLIDG